MLRTKKWLDSHGLKLATEKTELVFINKKHIPLHVEMQVLTEKTLTKISIKYFGLIGLETKLYGANSKLFRKSSKSEDMP